MDRLLQHLKYIWVGLIGSSILVGILLIVAAIIHYFPAIFVAAIILGMAWIVGISLVEDGDYR